MDRLTLEGSAANLLPNNSDDEEDDKSIAWLNDNNTCSQQELDQLFPIKYNIIDELGEMLKREYILNLAADSSFTRVVAALSSGDVQIFDINAGRSIQHVSINNIETPVTNGGRPTNICGVRFMDETPNRLLVGSNNGLVRLFDLRTQQEQVRFNVDLPYRFVKRKGTDNLKSCKGVELPKTISCFDSNANSRIICTGSEPYHDNVFLIFYDVRQRKQLGCYFESHQDEVTALRFHPTNPDLLCSGSTDGLINLYDIKATAENDEFLLTTINTESSVQKLNWHKNVYEQDIISCVTHSNGFHVYLCADGDLVAKFQRQHITTAVKRKSEANCNVVDAHNTRDGEIFLLTGTNHRKGEVLRTLRLQNRQLLPMADFHGNKQIVRISTYDSKTGILVTGGESGILTLWSSEDGTNSTLASNTNPFKQKQNKISIRATPY